MSHRNGCVVRPFTALLTLTAFAGTAAAQDARVGDVRTRQVISVSMNVASTDKEAKRVVYAPPPGWYIRSHRVDCTARYGLSSYAVNTVPAEWTWSAQEGTTQASRTRAAAGVAVPAAGGQGKLVHETNKVSAEQQSRASSHHALVLDATAQGAGFLRGGGGLELTVTAEMVYVGN